MGMSTYSNELQELDTYQELDHIVQTKFGSHPFSEIANTEELSRIFPDFIGLSHAFRYILAGAQASTFFEAMDANSEVPEAFERMNAVANMLLWDESGGLDLTLSKGKSALPEILNTQNMHSSLLKVDAEKILGTRVSARYSPITRSMLQGLHTGFSALDPLVRCAYLVAFEFHAGSIIEALWTSIERVSDVPCDELAYFKLHVGGDDPSEAYHIAMTQRLIESIVDVSDQGQFTRAFTEAYQLQVEWAQALVNPAIQNRTILSEIWHKGSCHCGHISFEVYAPQRPKVIQCNCSACVLSGFLSLIVSPEKFRILQGQDQITTYQFNTKVAQHTFCKSCGTKAFYNPRSHPESVSVNVRCLDQATLHGMKVVPFDGQNWEENIESLRATPT